MDAKFLVIKNTYKEGDSFVVKKEDIMDSINSYDDITQEQNKEVKQLSFMNNMLKKMGDHLCASNHIHQNDLLLASYVQKQFMPSAFCEDVNYEIATYYKPLEGVSGDFYDFFLDKKKLNGVGLFDVSGHGIASALITMVAKQLLRKPFEYFTKINEPLSEVMHAYNIAYQNELQGFDHYMTGVLVRFFNDNIEISSAGHTDPFIRRGLEDVEKINDVYGKLKGSIIGIPENLQTLQYESKKIPLHKNDILLLYTDGLTESQNINHIPYETQLPIDMLNNTVGAQDFLRHIIAKFGKFMEDSTIKDDITIIAIRKK
jgi:sigma-B regulation protein RsbU (phosphoserine phosphatase)